MRRLIWLFMAVSIYSVNSFAGIMVEPYLGYFTGKTTGSVEANSLTVNFDESISGPIYGARLGYSLPLLFGFGIEAAGGSIKSDEDTYKTTNLGAFVSVDLPILIRVFGTYFFSANATSEPDINGVDDVKYKGTGMKLGVGFTFLPMVSLNLEYVTFNYDEEDSSITSNLDQDVKGLIISASLPLDF